ncbi:hypothetical protein [Brevundimonas sp.]|uniref:hypothetical protein n=1 Tax=Brevundimonas sp. TaxID=1871086 RepID=UPI002D63F7F1|nr:hypothetical protein [Brevundimonas sp.]HYC69327.1 hypothetical protein [Brevundimonas sp.]
MIRKALLPALAASAVMVSTPALAQNFSVSLSFGSPGYSQGYGYAPGNLHRRAQVLAQHVDRLAWSGGVHRLQARSMARELNQYRQLEYRYARNGLSRAEYSDLDRRLDRIQYQLQRTAYRARW